MRVKRSSRRSLRSIAQPELLRQGAVFGSQVALSGSFFLSALAASFWLPPEAFAQLSMANASVALLAALLDLGMNQTSLKLAIEREKPEFISINLAVKATIFGLAIVVVGFLGASATNWRVCVVIAGGAATAFWTGTRTADWFRRQFTRLAILNGTFAVCRLVWVAGVIEFRNWVLIALGVHVIAQLPVHFGTLLRLRKIFSEFRWECIPALLKLSPVMFCSAMLFNSLPLLVQTSIFRTHDYVSSAAFGVTLTFLGPLDLLITTIRLYLLPQFLSVDLRRINVFGWGAGSMHVFAAGLAALLLLATIPATFLIGWAYDRRLPGTSTNFAIYFGAYALTYVMALLNLRSQRGRLIWLDLCVNALRAGGTALLAVIPGLGPVEIVVLAGAILLCGEVVLYCLLGYYLRPSERGKALLVGLSSSGDNEPVATQRADLNSA